MFKIKEFAKVFSSNFDSLTATDDLPTEECVICLEQLFVFHPINCGHKQFHSKCIAKLTECPLCREKKTHEWLKNGPRLQDTRGDKMK